MFSKKLLKRLPLEKIAIVLTAVALIALSVLLGGRTIESGSVTRSLDQLQQTDLKGNLVADLSDFVQSVVVSPSAHFVQGSGTILNFSYFVTTQVYTFNVQVVDKSGTVVKSIDSFSPMNAGYYRSANVWNGTGRYTDTTGIHDGPVPVGTYYLAFSADQHSTMIFPIYVDAAGSDVNGNNFGSLMTGISNVPTSRTINADNNESLHLYGGLNRPAYLSVSLYSNVGTFMNTLLSNSYRPVLGQQELFAWKGRSSGNQIDDNASFQRVQAGTYKLRISAVENILNPVVTESSTITVTVTRNGVGGTSSQFHVVSLSKYPDSLDVRNSGSSIRFSYTLSGVPTTMNATVYDTNGNRVVANLVPVGTCNGYVPSQNAICTYYADWNGVDGYSNSQVVAGNYKFKIEAVSNMYGSESSEVAFQVYSNNLGYNNQNNNGGYNPYDLNGGYTGFNNGYQTHCGTIIDVDANDPLCPAIQFAMSRKYIVGYPDGTVRLKDSIKRAEFLAVMASTFKYNVEQYSPYTDGALGFSDLYGKENQWYMKYLKTFYRTGIMTGYPDRTMKPERIMTTAELFVAFFKAAIMSPTHAAHFPSIYQSAVVAPYADTPLDASSSWYIYQAQFAKQFGLVTGSKFYPARGITRGQVVKLIYDMYQKGLLSL